MEPDRYQQNHAAYIIGLFCLIAGLGLFALSLYLLPYLFFGWQYNIPDFIMDFSTMIQEQYALTSNSTAWLICLTLDLPAGIFFVVADILSNRIDRKIYGMQKPRRAGLRSLRLSAEQGEGFESKGLVFKIVMLIIVIFIIAELFHWVISTKAG